jgi:hypothetical protein
MIDKYLEKVAREQSVMEYTAEDTQRLADWLVTFDSSDLQKLASGEIKLSYFLDSIQEEGGQPWVSRFQGTPFLGEALQLEHALLEAQARQQQASQAAQEADRSRWSERDAVSSQIDSIRLQKKMLDLKLVEATQASAPEAPKMASAIGDWAGKAVKSTGDFITKNPHLAAGVGGAALGAGVGAAAADKGHGFSGALAGAGVGAGLGVGGAHLWKKYRTAPAAVSEAAHQATAPAAVSNAITHAPSPPTVHDAIPIPHSTKMVHVPPEYTVHPEPSTSTFMLPEGTRRLGSGGYANALRLPPSPRNASGSVVTPYRPDNIKLLPPKVASIGDKIRGVLSKFKKKDVVKALESSADGAPAAIGHNVSPALPAAVGYRVSQDLPAAVDHGVSPVLPKNWAHESMKLYPERANSPRFDALTRNDLSSERYLKDMNLNLSNRGAARTNRLHRNMAELQEKANDSSRRLESNWLDDTAQAAESHSPSIGRKAMTSGNKRHTSRGTAGHTPPLERIEALPPKYDPAYEKPMNRGAMMGTGAAPGALVPTPLRASDPNHYKPIPGDYDEFASYTRSPGIYTKAIEDVNNPVAQVVNASKHAPASHNVSKRVGGAAVPGPGRLAETGSASVPAGVSPASVPAGVSPAIAPAEPSTAMVLRSEPSTAIVPRSEPSTAMVLRSEPSTAMVPTKATPAEVSPAIAPAVSSAEVSPAIAPASKAAPTEVSQAVSPAIAPAEAATEVAAGGSGRGIGNFVRKYPTAVGAVGGSLVGAGVGAASADEGNGVQGALIGGGVGAGLGAGAGYGLSRAFRG